MSSAHRSEILVSNLRTEAHYEITLLRAEEPQSSKERKPLQFCFGKTIAQKRNFGILSDAPNKQFKGFAQLGGIGILFPVAKDAIARQYASLGEVFRDGNLRGTQANLESAWESMCKELSVPPQPRCAGQRLGRD
jgi:hypothetical protein